MHIEFSLQTAILGSLGSSLILAGTLFYLWRIDRSQRALLAWSLAFLAQTVRMGAQLGSALGATGLSVVADILFAAAVFLIWRGCRELSGRSGGLRAVAALLLLATLWSAFGAAADVSFTLRTLPLYALAGGLLIDAGRMLFRLGRAQPEVGYGVLATLFVLLGLHYLDYPFLREVPWFAPIGFGIAAILMLGIGIVMLIITQRRQQAQLSELAASLRHEMVERQESSERFQAIAESSELGVVVADGRGSFVYCNPRYLVLSDSTPEEVRDGRWIEHLHPDDREPMRQRWRRAVATQSGFTMERRVVRTGGDILWARAHIAPIRSGDGDFRGFVATVEDVTALKETERALRLSEAKFAGAFHASLDYITLSDLDSGEIYEVNEAFERMTGWTRAEAIGRTAPALGIWPDRATRDEAIRRLRRDGSLHEYPVEIGTRDGRRIDCVLNASLINANGQRYLLGVVRDVSAKRQAEAALRQNEEKFSRIVHYSPAPLVITDAETGVVVDFNLAWQELFGYTRESAIGRTSDEFALWADPAERDGLYRALFASGGELDRHECRYRRADGTILFALVSGRCFDIGGRTCYLWSVTDITLRHRIEERMAQLNSELEARVEARTAELRRAQDELIRSEKLAALGALVAGVAHELNTPIGNSVTVASTLHERTQEFAEAVAAGALRRSTLNAYVDAARTASDLLLRSLDQARNLVASFKQVAVDQTSDQRRRFDLRAVVGEVLTTLSPTLRKTPFKVTLEIPEGIVLDSFPGPLGQVVTNFVTNALLHAFDGRRQGRVVIRAAVPEHGQVVMTVQDDGIGIAEEHARHIFDPFFTTKLGQGGSGLGLHIVYNIVTRVLGGRISVDSRLGTGTTFMLTMPLRAPSNDNDNF